MQANFIQSHKAYVEAVETNLATYEKKYGADRDTLYTFADNAYHLGYPVSPEQLFLQKVREVAQWYERSFNLEDLRSLYDRFMDWNSTITFFTSEFEQQIIDAFMFSICGKSSDQELWSGYTSHEINPPNFCARLNIPQQIAAYERRYADIELADLVSDGHPGRSEKLKGLRVPFCPDLSIEEREEYFLEGVRQRVPQWTDHYEEAVLATRKYRAWQERRYDRVPGSPDVKYHPFPEVTPDRLELLRALVSGAGEAAVRTLAGAVVQAIIEPDVPEAAPDQITIRVTKAEANREPALLTHEPALHTGDPFRPDIEKADGAFVKPAA